MFVVDCDGVRAAVVDPVLEIPADVPRVEAPEGCLSVPGFQYLTPRAERAVVTGRDVDARPVRLSGTGLLARCLQHEVDHLAGVGYLDRLPRAERGRAWREVVAAT